jgi:hypothetical protein
MGRHPNDLDDRWGGPDLTRTKITWKKNIANVGASTPLTKDDEFRMVWTVSTIRGWPTNNVVWDPINLINGRDFLAETVTYDAVLIHSVFHTHPNLMSAAEERLLKDKEVSRLHIEQGIEIWKKRLISTGARIIVAIDSYPLSMSGWQLGDLDGYAMDRVTYPRATTWKKESAPRL